MFLKRNSVPLKWKILFLKSIILPEPYFHAKAFKILQEYNRGEYYDFEGLRITFYPWKTQDNLPSCEYLVESYLFFIFPFLYGGDVCHPMSERESNYYDDINITISPNDIVLDCGAFVGNFTTAAAIKANKGQVFAIEPFQENVEFMQKNIEQNNLKNVTIIQKAVCDKEREVIIHNETDLPSASGIYIRPKKKDPRVIKGMTIDKIYKKYKLKSIDFIKMDIEGMEREALMGAREVITKFKPKLSICLYHLANDYIILPNIIKI